MNVVLLRVRTFSFLFVFSTVACSAERGGLLVVDDAGPRDAGPGDAGPGDAGPPDATLDGGFDAGSSRDAEVMLDAFVGRDAGGECTLDSDCAPPAEACAAVRCAEGRCERSASPVGTECRAAEGACDVAEVCDGVGLDCPSDERALGRVCRASRGACDVEETCDGVGAECPSDDVVAIGTVCRASRGACDAAETCDGVGAECPSDAVAAAGTVCRASAGACDVVETCDGASVACPSNGFAAAGTPCRASTGVCDVAEVCEGGASCPSDTGAAAACVPSTPITYSALGRNARFTAVDLNGTGRTVATVAPGAMVSLRVVGNWTDTNTSCPTCITQFYARLDGVFSLCLGSTTENATFDSTTSFAAPAARGVYVINPVATWEFSCIDGTSAPTEFGPSSLATLVVE